YWLGGNFADTIEIGDACAGLQLGDVRMGQYVYRVQPFYSNAHNFNGNNPCVFERWDGLATPTPTAPPGATATPTSPPPPSTTYAAGPPELHLSDSHCTGNNTVYYQGDNTNTYYYKSLGSNQGYYCRSEYYAANA